MSKSLFRVVRSLTLALILLPQLAGGETISPPVSVPFDFNTRFIWINIPSAELQFWDRHQLLIKMPVLVGKKNSPTPVLNTNLTSLDVRPTWIIPSVIVEREMLPRWRRDPLYLERNRIQVVELQGGVRRFIQQSGESNPLGLIRFNLRPYSSIYLHDTPKKELFDRPSPLVSHGCIRLRDAAGLLLALSVSGVLPYNTRLEKLAAENREIHFELTLPIPVYITYFTSWVDDKNEIQQAPDVYDWNHKEGGTP